jgi:hypothetical protein
MNKNHAERELEGMLAHVDEGSADDVCPSELLERARNNIFLHIDQLVALDAEIRIPARLAHAHEKAVRRNRLRLRRRVIDALVALAGRFKARRAELYVPVGNQTWRAKYAFRATAPLEDVDLKKQSTVGFAIATRKPLLSSDDARDGTGQVVGTYRGAQLVVPVVVSGPGLEERCLGVVRFLAEVTSAFSLEDAGLLSEDVSELAVLLQCLESLKSGDYAHWPFDPDRHGWCADRILKDIIDEFTEAISKTAGRAHLSTTLWHADWDLKEVWARTTTGYFMAYSRDSVPLLRSFTGKVISTSPPGIVSRCGPDEAAFYAKSRAKQMGLAEMASCPVFIPSSGARAMGAVNVYQFEDKEHDQTPDDDTIREFGRLVGQVCGNLERLRLQLINTHLTWRLQRSARLADKVELFGAQFHVLKDALCEYFGASGCTLFIPTESRQHLTIAASTGTWGKNYRCVEGLLVRQASEPSLYPLSEKGVIQYLYSRPGKALILNDVAKLCRLRETVDPELPETVVPRQLEHKTPDTKARRFLGIGIRMFNANWMVARVTRAMDQPPFTPSDAALLEHIASICQHHNLWIRADQIAYGACDNLNTSGDGAKAVAAEEKAARYSEHARSQPCSAY